MKSVSSPNVRNAATSEIGTCLAAFARLPQDERERCLHLINAYNDAVAETRTGRRGQSLRQEQIEQLVDEFRSNRFANIGPAMERYLSLLDRGWRWPAFV